MSSSGPIVVGYDGSSGGRDALALARRLAEALDRPVEVLSVLTYAPVSKTVDEYEVMLHRDEKRLAHEARKALDGLRVETLMIPSASPARELHDLCEARQATALVIGARRHDWHGHHRFDGLGGRMLSAGPCPVAIAPEGYCLRAPFAHVDVAYDGSSEADIALRMGERVATGAGARLRLIAVSDPHDPLDAAPASEGWAAFTLTSDGAERNKQAAERLIESATEAVAGDAEGIVLTEENAATAIVRAADVNDLIVLGSRGYGPFGRVLMGSTSHEIIERARCAVLITPRRAAVAEERSGHWRPVEVADVEPPGSRAT